MTKFSGFEYKILIDFEIFFNDNILIFNRASQ